MTTPHTSGAADLLATFSEMLVDLPNTEPFTLFKAGFDAALAAGQATAAPAQPAAQQGAADGFFLLLPQRPKPEAPAGTAGLDWDAYSGAQMLAFGRDCSDAAIAALRTEQPAPATQQAGERVYAFRRKGLDDFCTCDEARYEELSNKPHLFETRIFYTTPQHSTTAQSADSVPAVSDLPPLPAPDLRDVGTKPQEIKEFLKGYATEYARTAIAASARAADSVLEDAARYRWLRRWKGQEHEPPFTVQHEIDGTLWGGDLDAAIDAARKQGATHDR